MTRYTGQPITPQILIFFFEGSQNNFNLPTSLGIKSPVLLDYHSKVTVSDLTSLKLGVSLMIL